MQISNDELREIIRQELTSDSHVETVDESAKEKAVAAAVTVGTDLLVSMLASQSGREKLASLLVYLPDFFKRVLCNDSLPGLLQKVSPGKTSFIIPYISKLCTFSFTIIAAPLYIVASIIRAIGDEEAQVLSEQVRKTAKGGVDSTVPEEDVSQDEDDDDIIDAEWEEVQPEPATSSSASAGL